MAILQVPAFGAVGNATLSSAEVWYAEGGDVRVQTSAPASRLDGIPLKTGGAGIKFESGETVYYWLDGNVGASVVRMAVR